MLSFKTYYDSHTGRTARFSKTYSTREAVALARTFEGRVKLFSDYYRGWVIIPVRQTLREGTALISSSVLLSLCEVLEQFRRGSKSSTQTTNEFTKATLKRMYSGVLESMQKEGLNSDDYLKILYSELRNGLHHDLTPRAINIQMSPALLAMWSQDLNGEFNSVAFNPIIFLDSIENQLKEYIEELSDINKIDLRIKFDVVFKEFFKLEDLNNFYK